MTPLHISMMLHYYAIAEPYAKHDPKHAQSRAVTSYREDLINLEMLEADDSSPSGFRVTPKGEAYIKALQEIPLPVCQWIIPNATHP